MKSLVTGGVCSWKMTIFQLCSQPQCSEMLVPCDYGVAHENIIECYSYIQKAENNATTSCVLVKTTKKEFGLYNTQKT